MSSNYDIKRALEAPGTMGTLVNAIVYSKYGPDVYEWDPLTVYLELKDDFKADCSPSVLDRWSAMQIVMSTDAFFERLDAFLSICNTLADGSPFFQMFNPVTIEEAAWAITEVALNRELVPFAPAIKVYLKALLDQEGYTKDEYPEIFVQIFADDLKSEEVLELPPTQHPNAANTEGFVNEQLADLVRQFEKIPGLGSLNNWALRHSISEFISER